MNVAAQQSLANNSSASARNYADIQSLQSIKQLGQTDKDAALHEVSKQFESIMVKMMLKNMRSATNVFSEGNYLSSDRVSFYQDMLDDQWSLELTRGEGLGLAAQLAGQFGASSSDKHLRSDQLPVEQLLQRSHLSSVSATAQQPENVIANGDRDLHGSGLAVEKIIDSDAGAEDSTEIQGPEAFVLSMYRHAERAARQLGVDPQALIAQAALETGWGKHIPGDSQGNSSFNLFGIKADSRWSGERVEVDTLEYREGSPIRVKAAFRSYDSFAQSFDDYVSFISEQGRYQDALEQAGDTSGYLEALHKAGYATDPVYVKKIHRILEGSEFRQTVSEAAVLETNSQLGQG